MPRKPKALPPADEAPGLEPSGFTLEAFAAGHGPQLAAMQDRSQWLHLMCARQSGKTWADDGILFDNAQEHPDSIGVFLGLKGTAVKFSNWSRVWRGLCDRYGIPERGHNETSMLTTFPNGSRVIFAGTDDLTNVKKYLGNRLHNSVFVIDEAQDQRDSILRYILDQLIPPMMTPTTRIVMSGVLPDVEAGYFYEQAAAQELATAPHLQKSKGWSHHEWARVSNVHTPEAMEQLAKYKRDRGLADDDPQILRDWYMRRVWDPSATAYRYNATKNAYSPPWPEDLRYYSVGIDPGTRDRTAIVCWGWGPKSPDVWQVHERVWPVNANPQWSDLAKELQRIKALYPVSYWFYDAGSSQMTIDTFGLDYGIPVVKAAQKVDKAGQVARFSDLLATGRCHVLAGSALEEDLKKTRWDKDARTEGRYEWSHTWHPDVADAGRYGLQGYFDMHVQERKILTPAEAAKEEHDALIRKLYAPRASEGWQSPVASRLGLLRGGGDPGGA